MSQEPAEQRAGEASSAEELDTEELDTDALADEQPAAGQEFDHEQSADEFVVEPPDDEPLGDPGGPQEPLPSTEELVAQRDGYLNDLQRVTAEFANYRRKAAERQQETVAMAAAGIVEKVLPVLDACDAAAAQGAADVVPIRDALFGALEKEGLAKLDDPGAPFDPARHEAVAHEPGEGDAVIAEVLRAGYEWNSRVLRPAMVKVRG